jgi:hypothetical protein
MRTVHTRTEPPKTALRKSDALRFWRAAEAAAGAAPEPGAGTAPGARRWPVAPAGCLRTCDRLAAGSPVVPVPGRPGCNTDAPGRMPGTARRPARTPRNGFPEALPSAQRGTIPSRSTKKPLRATLCPTRRWAARKAARQRARHYECRALAFLARGLILSSKQRSRHPHAYMYTSPQGVGVNKPMLRRGSNEMKELDGDATSPTQVGSFS